MPRKKQRYKKKIQNNSLKVSLLLFPIFIAGLCCIASVGQSGPSLFSWISSVWDEFQYKKVEGYRIKIPSGFEVHGIDVSHHQGRIDWDKVSAMKSEEIRISFAFIKATEGMAMIDENFKRNWRESRKHGILRGAYHYFKPNINGKAQAGLFLRTVKLKKGDLPAVVDIEEIGGKTPDVLRERLKNWLIAVESKTGKKPIIYTGNHFYQTYLQSYFDEYPIWIAHYYQSDLRLGRNENWLFWQHSDKAWVNGIKHKVDFNVFNGDMESLQALCL